MPVAVDFTRLSIVGAAYLVVSALVANIAIGLVVFGATLGTAAFYLWLRNRDSLRALDRMLHDKAHTGLAALEKAAAHDGGA